MSTAPVHVDPTLVRAFDYHTDPEFVAERLALVPHVGPRSFFKDIERVEPVEQHDLCIHVDIVGKATASG